MENSSVKKKRISFTTRDLAMMGVCVGLIIVGGFIKIPTPLVPITLQDLFCLLTGLILGGVKGSLCVLIYLIMGLIGIPVFTAGGGPSYVLYPTFGYIVGFVFGTLFVGLISEYLRYKNNKKLVYVIMACFGAIVIIYTFGVTYMYYIYKFVKFAPIQFSKLLISGCALFLPTDITWCVLSSIIYLKIYPILQRNNRTNTIKN